METLIQQATRMNQTKQQNEQGKLGAFAGQVVTVSHLSDELGMSFGPAAERKMPVQHPFISQNAWIRSMPEKGTLFLMQNRFDSGQPEALKTIPTFSSQKSDDYEGGKGVYRTLYPGEHDIASSGLAFGYFSRRGHLDLRAGAAVKMQLAREDQEVITQAPTQRRNLLYNTAGVMGDEERIGIVKRWTSAAEEFYVKKNDKFVSERYFHLTNPAKEGPVSYLRHIEGHVHDDEGQEIKHGTTSIPLRPQSLWYTTTDEFLSEEIDQNGNKITSFPSTATTGKEVLIPGGNYRMVIGKNRDVSIDKDEKVIVQQNIDYTVGQNVTYNVTKNVTWNAGENRLFMDTTSGSEAVTLANPKGYGLTATNAGGGKLTLTGPGGASLGMESSGSTTMTAKKALNLTVDMAMTLSGKTFDAKFDKINLGKGAAIPAVLGMALQMYLDQHQHTAIAPGAPTTPPNVPSASFSGTPQSITSVKIMLMGNT